MENCSRLNSVAAPSLTLRSSATVPPGPDPALDLDPVDGAGLDRIPNCGSTLAVTLVPDRSGATGQRTTIHRPGYPFLGGGADADPNRLAYLLEKPR